MSYERAKAMLWAPVPRPAKKPAKPAKTWKTLEAGRILELTQTWAVAGSVQQPGTQFEVVEPVTNQSVHLRLRSSSNPAILWSTEWRPFFKKVRVPGKKQAKKQEDTP